MLFSAVGELNWYLAGSNRRSFIQSYLPRSVYEGVDHHDHLRGAYGPRLRGRRYNAQLANIIDLLKHKPNTRQAVIQLFDRRDLHSKVRDLPCTCTIQFLLRGGKLSAITYMRSNDAYRGLPHDIYCFTMLQEIVARAIGAELGDYQHIVGSLHIYDRDAIFAEQYLEEGVHPEREYMDRMPPGDPWNGIETLLSWERRTRLKKTTASEVLELPQTYWGDLGRVVAASHVPKSDSQRLRAIADSLGTTFFRSYILDRIHS
ncbi:thymidylate synthase (plasmid) [Rathayibacter sp. VKM Ac-2759]|uniref:thymidylate synthase n=1 Tax=Rathayibacter sp. VKM Ac-2759 TaxID=2609252 RepID=UPI001318FBB2|nr:thymidylate synthase [Rathayibacter sp. VKM Ac-2759]QHC68882.1 thymidylate synthase [Rathayibacter sp. VKM Ac-2759]